MSQIEVLDLIVNPDEYTIYRNGEVIALPKLSFELFVYLIENAQQICSLEQISAGVWQKTVVNNETVIQRITLLRKALGDEPKEPRYIESIRGRGYRLKVKPIYDIAKQKQPKPHKIVVIALLVLSLPVIGYGLINRSQYEESEENYQEDALSKIINRGEYYLDIGQSENIERAIELFEQALKADDKRVGALIGKSFAMSRLVCRYGRSFEYAQSAKQLAQRAVKLDTENSAAQRALAYSWDCLGNIEKALEHHQIAINLSPENYRSKSSAAHLYETKGELLEAYRLNLGAKKLQPDNPLTDLQIARVFELLKFTAQAESIYRNLFILYPDNVFINQALPRFLFYQGRFSEAKTTYETAVARGVERNDIVLNYAELIWLLEGKDKALPWFKQAANSNPHYSLTTTINQVVQGNMSVSQAELSIAALEQTVSNGNTWPYHYLEAAIMALWALNDAQQAIQLLQKSVDLGYLNSEYLTLSPLFSVLNNEPDFYKVIDNINHRKEKMNRAFLAEYPLPRLH